MAGGKFPAWSGATHELLFLGGDDHIMAASYSTQGDTFNAGAPRVWSPTPVQRSGVMQNFDVSPDGKRVVMLPRPAAEQTAVPSTRPSCSTFSMKCGGAYLWANRDVANSPAFCEPSSPSLSWDSPWNVRPLDQQEIARCFAGCKRSLDFQLVEPGIDLVTLSGFGVCRFKHHTAGF